MGAHAGSVAATHSMSHGAAFGGAAAAPSLASLADTAPVSPPTAIGTSQSGCSCTCFGAAASSSPGGLESAVRSTGAFAAPPAESRDRDEEVPRHGSASDRRGRAGSSGDASASANADAPVSQADVGRWVSGDVDGLNPDLLGRLAALGEELGHKVTVTSGFRSRAEQAALYEKYKNGTGNLAAPPGQSNHESGDAADVNVSGTPLRSYRNAAEIARRLGLAFPVSSEAWHVEVA